MNIAEGTQVVIAYDFSTTSEIAFERGVELGNAGVDELHPAIVARGQRIEDGGIEDEGAVHTIGEAQRVVERGVVEIAQITTKPDEGGGHCFVQDKDVEL